MKRIKSYTLGWDTERKEGYINAIDEYDQTHVLGPVSIEEFTLISFMLKEGKVHIDNNHWIIAGWDNEQPKIL